MWVASIGFTCRFTLEQLHALFAYLARDSRSIDLSHQEFCEFFKLLAICHFDDTVEWV